MIRLDKIEKFDESKLEELLAPVWNSKKVVGETGLIVGNTGSVRLLSTPIKGSVVVKNIFQDILYEEGVDYAVDGAFIKRIDGGDLPYFEADEYFRKEPNAAIMLKADPAQMEFSFPEQRYIYFSEGVDGFNRYISVSYAVEREISSGLIAKDERLQAFADGLKGNKRAKLLLYGDSITVGCNATGTKYGGNVSPYLPDWNTLIAAYCNKKYGAEITVCNKAVGGWSTIEAVDNFEEKCRAEVPNSDLFAIGFGTNDLFTDLAVYKERIKFLIDEYFKDNPKGSVLLYSGVLPNNQAIGWRTKHQAFEDVLCELAAEYERVGVVKIATVFSWVETCGKKARDVFANSINHPNDFGVRLYAQAFLKTLFGEEFL